jgi:hypothetical protein
MSPRSRHLILALSLAGATVLRAETPAPDAKPLTPYVLKNKSAFAPVTDELRAPFWPIGWTKRKPNSVAETTTSQQVEAPRVAFDEKTIKVTSILLGTPSLAIINGRTYSEGEFLRAAKTAGAAPTGSAVAPVAPVGPRIRLYRIADGSVVLQVQDQLVTVALLRPELVQRSSAEEFLSEDRP